MTFVELTDGVLFNYARVVDEVPWDADHRNFVVAVTLPNAPLTSHISRGAFIAYVRRKANKEISLRKGPPEGISQEAMSAYFKADRTVIKSGRPYVFDDKKDQRDYRA